MTGIGSIYGEALYTLVKEDNISETILHQMKAMNSCFSQNPDYLLLLNSPNLSKAERCNLLDDGFRGYIEDYLLNFMKLLTERGHIRHFADCVTVFRDLYNLDHNILPVTAVSAVALTAEQASRLTEKLHTITDKRIELTSKLDFSILGGMRLEFDGKRVDDTVSHRLKTLSSALKCAVL